jgi:superfamily II DNA or RNA helicase
MQMALFDEPRQQLTQLAGRTPRPYQFKAVQAAFEQFEEGAEGTLLRSPTGTGKSFMLAMAAHEHLSRSESHRVIIGLHEITLIHQLAEDLQKTLGIAVGVEQGEHRVDMKSYSSPRVIIFSRQSLDEKVIGDEKASRLYKFDHSAYEWLFVLDECHRWRYGMPSCKHVIEWFAKNPKNKRLGLTATPKRRDKAKFTKLFPSVCLDYRFTDAVNDGWLVPFKQQWVNVKGVHIEENEVSSQIKMDKRFDELLADVEQLRAIVEPAIALCQGQTIAYCPDVKSCYAVAAEINAQIGWNAAKAIDGSIKHEERQYIYEQHKRGDFRFLVVCNLCREGYDDPNVSHILCLRPVRKESSHLAEQMKGRGVRPHSSIAGKLGELETAEERRAMIAESEKPCCHIIDLAGITGLKELPTTLEILAEGLPDDVIARAKKKAAEGDVDPMKALEEAEEEIKSEREELARRDAEARAKIRTRVDWEAREVGSGQGGSYQRNWSDQPEMSTWKQVYKLTSLGVDPTTARGMTKDQASKQIQHLTYKKGPTGTGKPTQQHIALAEKFGKPAPKSYEDGVRLVQEINNQIKTKRA